MKENSSLGKNFGTIILGIIIIIGMFVLIQVPQVVLVLFNKVFEKNNQFVNILLSICWLLILAGIIWFMWGYYRKKSGDVDTKITGKDVWRAVKFFLLGRVIAILGTGLMEQFYGNATSANDETIQSLFSSDASVYFVLLMAVTIAVGAPILEELVFRGIPTALLFKNTSKWVPLILTSLAFSSVHLFSNPISFAMYAILGGIMYWAYCYKGRIIDSMMFHFLNNIFGAIALLISYFTGQSIF